jgi:hypothetical protein
MILARATFAHYGRQNRSFEENTTKREKGEDWLAVDAVSRKPFSCQNSLLTGKNTGNIAPSDATLSR